MDWINAWTDTLWFAGVPYPPGAVIPATVDPAQLAYFAAQGIVEPTTAPVPVSVLRRVLSAGPEQEVSDASGAHDGTE